ncbi:hypothetical protein H5410_020938 [Solanum commersonii]|uniref:Putative plant transposon protein domain-containing protein n=1 Tax=Solanum commersonii TaxID=4109 RepID=A0A9J5Z9W2_SOLCO|nr:hypothetical protein H5410_020938 [Solanum commersonii]
MVGGCSVDVSDATISHFLYGPNTDRTSCEAALSRGMLSSERLLYYGWLSTLLQMAIMKSSRHTTSDNGCSISSGVEIDFACMLLAEIHEGEFKTSTTYPFPCLIFHLCRDSGVPIWHCDRLTHPIGTLDIGLIRDEANAQGGDPIMPDHTDTISASSSQAASRAPSSPRSTPPLGVVVVLLARV